jgi:hypothetical protein
MDMQQRKLNKSEWDSIEIPVSQQENDVLHLIIDGYTDVNIKVNKTKSIFAYLKIEYSEKMEDFLFHKFFGEKIQELIKLYKLGDKITFNVNPKIQIKTADRIRLENSDTNSMKDQDIYEFVLFEHIENILKFNFMSTNTIIEKNIEINIKNAQFHYFTLFKLIQNNIQQINRNILQLAHKVLEIFEETINMETIIENSVEFIEKNKCLLKYSDLTLYEHQKEIFTVFKKKHPKLVLYIAPTGTGKTLSPLALTQEYKVIFVCAARHVGLALAKAAISVQKKVAFAFGCTSAADIRLHYYAANDYTINKRSGGIGKVDNSNGQKVELMICDIKSYLPAMYYMKSFFPRDELITYWDEPTITMDYAEHEFHDIIHTNWRENVIPNMVLSSATLPKLHELTETIADFKNKFSKADIFNIVSHDCKKSIPLINKDGFAVLPHYLSDNYSKVLEYVKHSENYLTLLRYFDLKEVSTFIIYILKNGFANSKMKLERHFEGIDDLNMKNIKVYYLNLLQNILSDKWETICIHAKITRVQRIPLNETVDNKGNKIVKARSVGPGVPLSNSNSNSNNNNNNSSIFKMGVAGAGGGAGSELSRQSSVQQPLTTPPSSNGLLVTTKDSYTLTDGPTIFISDDVEKIGKFCVQQANIPALTMKELIDKIEYNNFINKKIMELETELESVVDKTQRAIAGSDKPIKDKDVRKFNRDVELNGVSISEISNLKKEIDMLKSNIKPAALNDTFIPNKHHHLVKWANGLNTTDAFTSNIEEGIVNKIMTLYGIDDTWKVLLLMGIGVFTNHNNIQYTEIMKQLADEQKLYMIIASSDYIYGTNYSFCHGYLSKDLNLTQEKIIQALGRIGRNNVQQNYTLRFRDNEHIMKLFTTETDKPEIKNMNRLFNSTF